MIVLGAQPAESAADMHRAPPGMFGSVGAARAERRPQVHQCRSGLHFRSNNLIDARRAITIPPVATRHDQGRAHFSGEFAMRQSRREHTMGHLRTSLRPDFFVPVQWLRMAARATIDDLTEIELNGRATRPRNTISNADI